MAEAAMPGVDLPSELASAFEANPAVKRAFDALAYTHRREYAVWVGGAKTQETRDRRAAKAIEMVRAGERLS